MTLRTITPPCPNTSARRIPRRRDRRTMQLYISSSQAEARRTLRAPGIIYRCGSNGSWVTAGHFLSVAVAAGVFDYFFPFKLSRPGPCETVLDTEERAHCIGKVSILAARKFTDSSTHPLAQVVIKMLAEQMPEGSETVEPMGRSGLPEPPAWFEDLLTAYMCALAMVVVFGGLWLYQTGRDWNSGEEAVEDNDLVSEEDSTEEDSEDESGSEGSEYEEDEDFRGPIGSEMDEDWFDI